MTKQASWLNRGGAWSTWCWPSHWSKKQIIKWVKDQENVYRESRQPSEVRSTLVEQQKQLVYDGFYTGPSDDQEG